VVRRAEQRDVPRIAATLTVALGESRWTRWALPQDGRMQRLTRWHELDAGHRGVATGTTWVSDDVDAVASWRGPAGAPDTEPVPDDVRAALARELPYLAGPRWNAVERTRSLLERALPSGPHWELVHLGTRPSARRRGLGSAVLAPVLARCDDDGVPAAAAVYSWAGVRFLRRLGFEVAEAVEGRRAVHDELPLWVLVRDPVESGAGRSYRG
jgi:GNAT superfamily N-acetyltransferase